MVRISRILSLGLPAVLLLVILLHPAQATPPEQPNACPVIVERVLETVDRVCQTTGRNQACYGSSTLEAEPQPGQALRFSQEGDLADVARVRRLTLSPLNMQTGQWGISLMRLQANLPDTLPGQNITFLLFGDVELTDAMLPGMSQARPMQAVYLRSGIGAPNVLKRR